jgi:proton-dependent oligopeptide transporter, POT family
LTSIRIFSIYYMGVNIGTLSPTATTELEQHFGFSSAFALPALVLIVGLVVLVTAQRQFVSEPPNGSVLPNAFKVIWVGLKYGNFEAAKSSGVLPIQGDESMKWDDHFVDELSQALKACKLFLFFPLFWMAYVQMMTNFISQAGTMDTHSIPNDILLMFNPLTVILMAPILERLVYPWLRRIGITFRPTMRITLGFLLISVAMAYAALVQHLIYSSPPCYNYPRAKDCLGGKFPNQIHVAVQTPAYILCALSEVFVVITGYEWAFTKAPKSMKSLVMAIFLSTVSVGSLLAILINPVAVDPKLTWMYSGLSIGTFCAGLLFWLTLHKMDSNPK